MTASEIALLVLVLVAFVLGWFTRGRRIESRGRELALQVDVVLGAALTSLQAVMGLWESRDAALFDRAVNTFVARCREVAALAADARVPAGAAEAIASARSELDRVAAMLQARATLDLKAERQLLSAERRLAAARVAYLRAVAASAV